jgi:hypothetical protein
MNCNVCELEKPPIEFRSGRKTCNGCENKKRYQRKINQLKNDPSFVESNKVYDAKRKRDKRKSISKDSIMYVRESISSLIRQSIKGRGYSKKTKTYVILGESYEYVRKYIESQFEEGMSWSNHGKWHIDHKVPSCSAQSYEEIISLNHYTNFRPLWAKENLSKSGNINRNR